MYYVCRLCDLCFTANRILFLLNSVGFAIYVSHISLYKSHTISVDFVIKPHTISVDFVMKPHTISLDFVICFIANRILFLLIL